MALKTFNIDKEAYAAFSKHCKREGLSMSRKIENYIKAELSRIRCDVAGAAKDIESFGSIGSIGNAGAAETRKEPENKKNEEHSFRKYC